MSDPEKTKPAALVSLTEEEYDLLEPLSDRRIEAAFAEGREARRAVEAETPHPVVSARVRFH